MAEEAARDRQQRMCYWGYRFEQLSTSGPPGGRGGGGGSGSGYRIASPSDLASGALLGEGGLSEAGRADKAAAHLQEEAPGGAAGGEGAVNANEEFCAVPCLDPTLALTLALALTLSLTLALALTLALTFGLN